jgi:hypothetical protein
MQAFFPPAPYSFGSSNKISKKTYFLANLHQIRFQNCITLRAQEHWIQLKNEKGSYNRILSNDKINSLIQIINFLFFRCFCFSILF